MTRRQVEFDDVRMRGFKQRSDVADVWRLVDAYVPRMPSESIEVINASGRVLTEDIVSPVDVPGFDRSAMDGYAVTSHATPGEFVIVGDALPGRPFGRQCEPGQAVRIMTGAPLPCGADCVVPVELAEPVDDQICVPTRLPAGRNVGRRGEDVEAGNVILNAGRLLRPQDAGLMAAIGIATVPVVRRPTVSVLVTGDELLPAGSRPEGFRIVDSNSVTLRGLLQRDCATVIEVTLVRDRVSEIREALARCRGDLILITGGSSVGTEDFAPGIIAEIGELLVHGVNLRPASPLGFGVVHDRPVFLLPGNPVACLCAYDVVVHRAVQRMSGCSSRDGYRTIRLPLAEELISVAGRTDYVRVAQMDGEAIPLRRFCGSGASILSSTTRADGFLLIPSDTTCMPRGMQVEVHLYHG